MTEVLVLNLDFPVAGSLYTLHGVLGTLLPIIEVADYKDICGVWSPFPENPGILSLMKAEVQVT